MSELRANMRKEYVTKAESKAFVSFHHLSSHMIPDELIDILIENLSNFELVYENGMPTELKIRFSSIDDEAINICNVLEKNGESPRCVHFYLGESVSMLGRGELFLTFDSWEFVKNLMNEAKKLGLMSTNPMSLQDFINKLYKNSSNNSYFNP